MKRFLFLSVILSVIFLNSAFSQTVGFSYFFPKYGHFSNPVAPVNFSLPIKAGNFFQISPGIGMYNIGGMSMAGFPEIYNSKRALIGPFQSLELTLLPAVVLPFKSVKIYFVGGVFGFFGFNQKLIQGEFNNMMSEANNYSSFDSQADYKNNGFGCGYIYGIKLSFKVNKKTWGYIGANYYTGSQLIKINGSYIATTDAATISTGNFNFSESGLMYQGLQISIGAILK